MTSNDASPGGFAEQPASDGWKPAKADAALRRTTHILTVGAKGRVLLTAQLRAALGVKEGDKLVCLLDDGVLSVKSQSRAIKEIQTHMRSLVPEGLSIVDEFIADKRREAAREWDEDLLGPLPALLAPFK